MIRFKCSSCSFERDIADQYAGKKVLCPKCKTPNLIANQPSQPQKPVNLIKFNCPLCHKKLAVPAGFAGRRVKCNGCSHTFAVPAEQPPPENVFANAQNLLNMEKQAKAVDMPELEKMPRVSAADEPKEKKSEKVLPETKKQEEKLPVYEILQDFKDKLQVDAEAEIIEIEQRIGTRWVLILGVITVIVGVIFFLKYAYDNNWIGPLGRVVIVAAAGLAALCAGEITRRRGYEIVAKAMTALGFAMLYAADFTAYRFYELIGPPSAFILAILVTLGAVIYAVGLDEILIAVLFLIGGFLTPLIVSTGDNLPIPLFSYVLILGAATMLCACYRKWRVVNLIAFVGTFILYGGWFENFFRSQLAVTDKAPEQIAIAISWLWGFFIIYMVLPLLNDLVRKAKAQKEDVLLILSNAAVTYYYLWTILYTRYRDELALCSLGLCISHLVIRGIVSKRCKEDSALKLALLAAGLFFLTIAIPLYLNMYAVAIAWAAEAVILTLIGIRYRSVFMQICAGVAFVLSVFQLIFKLPMHHSEFVLVWNPAFGSWLFVVLAAVIFHILYRKNKWVTEYNKGIVSQIYYSAACLLLMLTLSMEWFCHCTYNIAGNNTGQTFLINGLMLLFTLFTVLFVARPVCPAGVFCRFIAVIFAFAGSVFTIYGLTRSYHGSFVIFANINFAFAVLFVAGLFAASWILKQTTEQNNAGIIFSYLFLIAAIFVLFILLNEEIYLYWYCGNKYSGKAAANWEFLANMYMSIAWAIYAAVLMVAGFWRKTALLRYISLGLFGVLLFKVFILDMRTVKSVYRIAAFLATGITLVGISYLYQFLKKKGFFETVLNDNKL